MKQCEWHRRREKSAEALGTAIDLLSSKTHITNFPSFRIEFHNLAVTPILTIKEVFLAIFLVMKEHWSN